MSQFSPISTIAPLFTILPSSSLPNALPSNLITYTQHSDKTIAAKHGYDPEFNWPTTPLAIRIGLEDQEYNDGLYAGFPSGDTSPVLIFGFSPETQSHLSGLLNLLQGGASPAGSLSLSAFQAADSEMLSHTGISPISNPYLRQVLLLLCLRGALANPEKYNPIVHQLASAGPPLDVSVSKLSFPIDQNMANLPYKTEAALIGNGWWTPYGFHATNLGLSRLWGKKDETEETWKELFDAMVEAGYFHGEKWSGNIIKQMRRSVLTRVAEVGAAGLMGRVLEAVSIKEMDKGEKRDLLRRAALNGVEMVDFLANRGIGGQRR